LVRAKLSHERVAAPEFLLTLAGKVKIAAEVYPGKGLI
jgi:hypothetical protein